MSRAYDIRLQRCKGYKIASGKIKSSLEYCRRPPLIGDPHGRLIGDSKLVILNPQSFCYSIKVWGLRRCLGVLDVPGVSDKKLGVSNKNLGSSMKSLESPIKNWSSK